MSLVGVREPRRSQRRRSIGSRWGYVEYGVDAVHGPAAPADDLERAGEGHLEAAGVGVAGVASPLDAPEGEAVAPTAATIRMIRFVGTSSAPPNAEPVAAPRGSGSRGRNPRAGRNPTRSLGPMASHPRMPRGAPHRPRRNVDDGGRVTREHPDREPGEAPATRGVCVSRCPKAADAQAMEERARRYRLHADTPSNRATTAGNVARASGGRGRHRYGRADKHPGRWGTGRPGWLRRCPYAVQCAGLCKPPTGRPALQRPRHLLLMASSVRAVLRGAGAKVDSI